MRSTHCLRSLRAICLRQLSSCFLYSENLLRLLCCCSLITSIMLEIEYSNNAERFESTTVAKRYTYTLTRYHSLLLTFSTLAVCRPIAYTQFLGTNGFHPRTLYCLFHTLAFMQPICILKRPKIINRSISRVAKSAQSSSVIFLSVFRSPYLPNHQTDLHQSYQKDGKWSAVEKLNFWFLNSFKGGEVQNVTFGPRYAWRRAAKNGWIMFQDILLTTTVIYAL